MGYSRKPSYHFNSEADVIGDVPLNRTIVCNSFLGVPSVSFKYITSSSASTIKAAYEAGNLEPIQSVLSSSATYAGNLLGTHAGTLKFFTDIYSGATDETVSLTLTLSGALDSQIVLKDTNALWIEYTGSCTFDEALSTYGVYFKEKAAAQADTKYSYGCVSLENSSLTWSADITSNGAQNPSGKNVHVFACLFNSYIKAIGVTLSGASGHGINLQHSKMNFSSSTSQNNTISGIFCGSGSSLIATYSSFLNNSAVGVSGSPETCLWINGSTITGNGSAGVYSESSKIYMDSATSSNNSSEGIIAVSNSFISLNSTTIDNNGQTGVYSSQSFLYGAGSMVTNNGVHGVELTNGSKASLPGLNSTNNDNFGVYVHKQSLFEAESSGTITGNSGAFDLVVTEASLAKIVPAVSVGSSNISANTHYNDGAYIANI